MHRLSWGIACLFAVGLGTAFFALAGDHGPAARIAWKFNLEEAHAASKQSNKPMLIVIGAPWCEYSRKLDQATLSDAGVQQVIHEDFVPVLVSFDRDRDIARKLEVKSLPCTVILSPEADLLGRLVGHVDADQYRDALVASRRLQDRVQQVRYQKDEK